jgi:hypothetical protein
MLSTTWLRFRSLKTKLLAWFLVLGLLPAALVGTLAYRSSRDALLARAGEALQVHAQAVLDKIDRTLFERYGDALGLAGNPDARGTRKQVSAVANFYTQQYGIYDLILVADKEGVVLAANTITLDGKPLDTAPLIGQSVKGQDWFEKIVRGEVKRGKAYYGDLAEDRWVAQLTQTRGLTLTFAAPVLDEDGELVRVWSIRASWERIVGHIMSVLRETLKAHGISTVETQVHIPHRGAVG